MDNSLNVTQPFILGINQSTTTKDFVQSLIRNKHRAMCLFLVVKEKQKSSRSQKYLYAVKSNKK